MAPSSRADDHDPHGAIWASFSNKNSGALRSIQLEHAPIVLFGFRIPRIVISQHSLRDYMIVGILRTGRDTRMTDKGGSLTEQAPRRSTFSVQSTDLLIFHQPRVIVILMYRHHTMIKLLDISSNFRVIPSVRNQKEHLPPIWDWQKVASTESPLPQRIIEGLRFGPNTISSDGTKRGGKEIVMGRRDLCRVQIVP